MKTIALVDDQDGIRDMIQRALEMRGYSVIPAKDGAEGLDCIRNHEPDLVITDLEMPEKSGLEMLREAGDLAPIAILMTGKILGEDEDILSGFDDLRKKIPMFFKKPLHLTTFLGIVDSIFAGK